jgi:hypothetical protein
MDGHFSFFHRRYTGECLSNVFFGWNLQDQKVQRFVFYSFFLEFTRPKGTEILWEFTAGNLLEPAVMLNTRDEQHTLSQPTKRRANTAHGKEGLKHASTRREIQNAGQGKRGEDRLRPCTKATKVE